MGAIVLYLLGILSLLTGPGWVGVWSFFVKTPQPTELLNLGTLVFWILLFPVWFKRSRNWASAQESYFWQQNRWALWLLLHACLPLGAQVITIGLRLRFDKRGSIERATARHHHVLWILYISALAVSIWGVLFR